MSDIIQDLMRRIGELERRQNQMVIRGTVSKLDFSDKNNPVVRVAYGDGLETGWLPWKAARTGAAVVWWPPEVGEGVTVYSNGDLANGEVVAGSYHAAHPAPSNDPDLFFVDFGNGTTIQYHRVNNKLSVNVVGDSLLSVSGNVVAEVGGDFDASIDGKATANVAGDMSATVGGDLAVDVSGAANVNAETIGLNDGNPCVTTGHICHFTGMPHGDGSTTVRAGK